jgi:hypothetical protein
MRSKRNAVDYSRSDVGRSGKTFQTNGQPYLHRTGETNCAPSKVHKDYLTPL